MLSVYSAEIYIHLVEVFTWLILSITCRTGGIALQKHGFVPETIKAMSPFLAWQDMLPMQSILF